ncbi:hypothetical protein CHS0354_040028 [Potamilus streckersoni]|uniref:Uncharacterized protein n=1 Tax=Potamilus streckersoni TaxID=2493646 RepID=A0AAE0W0M4_9BIVA|nr:hypothetical protein CHS0354_040028 [Potamilus streckersoni]
MPGVKRAFTSYDVYNDFDRDALLDDLYPSDGRESRTNGYVSPVFDGRYSPTGRPSPDRGIKTPAMRPPSRPLGRGYLNTDKHVSYVTPHVAPRPTSPVMKALQRSNTSPMIQLPPEPMDPFTKAYYHRQWRTRTPSPNIALNRQGRAGGVWRHVRACIANTGNHICFIDGSVKQEDNFFFPVVPKVSGSQDYTYAYLPPPSPKTRLRIPQTKAQNRSNLYHNHAKQGFKYWYQEPKPIDYSTKYSFGAEARWLGVPETP